MSTFRHLQDDVSDPGSAEALSFALFESSMTDRRDEHSPLLKVKGKPAKVYSPPKRPWTQVRGITLHQTACVMGERIARWDTLGAHFGIPRSGRILRMCDLNRIVYHGNGWNNRCVGIEVDGLFAGQEDDPDTAQDESLRSTWDDPTTPTREMPMQPTPQQLVAVRQLVRWIMIETARNGGAIKYLVAHRQASGSRRNDPGECIWKPVALPLIAELGLDDAGDGFKLDDGYPIPTCWNPAYAGVPY